MSSLYYSTAQQPVTRFQKSYVSEKEGLDSDTELSEEVWKIFTAMNKLHLYVHV